LSCGRETVNKQMIADEQRFLHGARGDLKLLENERDNEQPADQHGSESGDRFRQGLFLPFLLFFLVLWFCCVLSARQQGPSSCNVFDYFTRRNVRFQRVLSKK